MIKCGLVFGFQYKGNSSNENGTRTRLTYPFNKFYVKVQIIKGLLFLFFSKGKGNSKCVILQNGHFYSLVHL